FGSATRSGSSVVSAKPGMVQTPQWIMIPSLASSYQAGRGRVLARASEVVADAALAARVGWSAVAVAAVQSVGASTSTPADGASLQAVRSAARMKGFSAAAASAGRTGRARGREPNIGRPG